MGEGPSTSSAIKAAAPFTTKILLLVVALAAALVPYMLLQTKWWHGATAREKPFLGLMVGAFVSMIVFYPVYKLVGDSVDDALAMSIMLGILVAEFNLFGIHEGLPSIETVALLVFIFFRYSHLGGAVIDDHTPEERQKSHTD